MLLDPAFHLNSINDIHSLFLKAFPVNPQVLADVGVWQKGVTGCAFT